MVIEERKFAINKSVPKSEFLKVIFPMHEIKNTGDDIAQIEDALTHSSSESKFALLRSQTALTPVGCPEMTAINKG